MSNNNTTTTNNVAAKKKSNPLLAMTAGCIAGMLTFVLPIIRNGDEYIDKSEFD